MSRLQAGIRDTCNPPGMLSGSIVNIQRVGVLVVAVGVSKSISILLARTNDTLAIPYTYTLGTFFLCFLNARDGITNKDLGHLQVGSYRYRSLIEGLYAL